jgi:hypothetical protein
LALVVRTGHSWCSGHFSNDQAATTLIG